MTACYVTDRQIVVNRVVFRRQLCKEQLCQIRHLRLVLETLCHLAQLPLDLDHPTENEMHGHHKRVLLDDQVVIRAHVVKLSDVDGQPVLTMSQYARGACSGPVSVN